MLFSAFFAITSAMDRPVLTDAQINDSSNSLLGLIQGIPGNQCLFRIWAANKLIDMGHVRANAVLEKIGTDPRTGESLGRELFWLIRIAYTSNRPNGAFRIPMIAIERPLDSENWPTFPVILKNDIPFVFDIDTASTGISETFSLYFSEEKKHLKLREKKLRPPVDPFNTSLQMAHEVKEKLKFVSNDKINRNVYLAAVQMIGSEFSQSISMHQEYGITEYQFIPARTEFLKGDYSWDERKERYISRLSSSTSQILTSQK